MTAIAENTTATVESYAHGTTALVDPKTLTIAANARKDVSLPPEFLASVKELGVLQPIVVEATENGLHVLYGQRRTLAAIEGGRNLVPVFISDAQTESDRIAKQVAENEHRASMTDADRADAYQQLSLLGMSATAIAKRVSMPKAQVADALKAKSDTTSAGALDKGLTIQQSVALAEFADDPALVEKLEATALNDPGHFNYEAQKQRDARARQVILDQAKADATARNLTIVDEDPSAYYYSGPNAVLGDLSKADGSEVTEDYADAAYVGLTCSDTPVTVLVVTDWKGRGFKKAGKGGGMTDAQKAERKELIKNNRDMDTAITVRKAWVTELLARKIAPKGGGAFVAAAIANHSYTVSKGISNHLSLAGEFLGAKENEYGAYAKLAARPGKAETATLAAVLAAFEADMTRQSWRTPQVAHRDYLNQLATWGYQPSDVEKIITAK